MPRWCFLWIAAVLAVRTASARDLYVNVESGSDANPGSSAAPLATAQRAVTLAEPGDTVHLLPEGALYRQMIHLRGKTGITIDGHGATLTGADPLPEHGWETVGARLHRRRLKTNRIGREERCLLIVGGRAERMGRSPSVKPPFPPPENLKDGQFAWQAIDAQEGWLYVRGDLKGLEWAVRAAGLATSGRNRDITVRNLNARHALNDGFNIHGDSRGMRFGRVTGYENYDEGFSAHDTCQCWIEDGRFRGNDNAAYDVNSADTYYTRCEFRQSVSVEMGLMGGRHVLTDCRITADGPVAFSLTVAPPAGKPSAAAAEKAVASCRLERVQIRGSAGAPRRVVIGPGAAAELVDCELTGVDVQAAGATVRAQGTTLEGRPWTPP